MRKINNFGDYIKEAQQKKSSLIAPSDQEVEEAEKYLEQGVDPEWDKKEFGFFYIDVSGKYSVYYTLWRFKPKTRDAYNFITNLSTDFRTAVEKAKKAAGRVPVIIDRYGTQAGMFRDAKSELINFGKYRGKTLGDIFVEDPQYILWLAKNYDGKSPERKEKLDYYRDLYWETVTKKNLESSKSEWVGKIGDKITFEAEVYEIAKERNEFNTVDNRCKLIDDNGNKYFTYNIGTKVIVKKGDRIKVTAKVAKHIDKLGIKFTVINYCKVHWNQREDLEKYNL